MTAVLSLSFIAVAAAETITLDSSKYYYLAGSDTGQEYRSSSGQWRAYWHRINPDTTNEAITYGNANIWATSANNIYYGYTYRYENGTKYAYANGNPITLSWQNVAMANPNDTVHFSGYVTHENFTALTDDVTLQYGDLGVSTSTLLDMVDSDTAAFSGSLTLTGSLILTGDSFTRTILSEDLHTNTGTIDISGLNVKDALNNSLVYTNDTNYIGKSGYFWLTETYDESTGVTTFAIAAQAAVPEPTTATLSLLALAGLAARRRRK